jgi:hypothetical protein
LQRINNYSLRYATLDDIHAIVAYLRSPAGYAFG